MLCRRSCLCGGLVVRIRFSSWYKKKVVDIDIGSLLTSLLYLTQRGDKHEKLQLTSEVRSMRRHVQSVSGYDVTFTFRRYIVTHLLDESRDGI
jgi:hypothetical protein